MATPADATRFGHWIVGNFFSHSVVWFDRQLGMDKQFDWSIIQGGLLAYAVTWSLVMLAGGNAPCMGKVAEDSSRRNDRLA